MESRQQRRRAEFEAALYVVNSESEIPPGNTTGRGAPAQFHTSRKERRTIARSRVRLARVAQKSSTVPA